MKVDSKAAMIGAGLAGAALFAAALFFAANDSGASATKSNAAAFSASERAGETLITSGEAQAWAQARAADTTGAYKVYLAAFPEGAFAKDAEAAIERPSIQAAAAATPAPRRVQPVAARQSSSNGPSRSSIAASCRQYVDAKLSAPSRTGRAVGGAAAGCAVGAMAGGDDGRNCVVGAVVGAGAGALSAENRERRRLQEVQYCIANGGPPR